MFRLLENAFSYQKTLSSSSHSKNIIKKTLKNFAIFTGKQLRCSLFLIKVAGLEACNFIKKRLQDRCFPVNIVKFLRIPIRKSYCDRLLLSIKTFLHTLPRQTSPPDSYHNPKGEKITHSHTGSVFSPPVERGGYVLRSKIHAGQTSTLLIFLGWHFEDLL